MENSNRKLVNKSLSQLRKNFDNLTEEEMSRLESITPYNYSPEYGAELRQGLVNKPERPFFFQQEEVQMDLSLLVKQFLSLPVRNKTPLFHNFSTSSSIFRKNMNWNGFQFGEDLFSCVHFQLYESINPKPLPPKLILREREFPPPLNTSFRLQNVLVESASRATNYTTREMMESMENLLESFLVQVILTESLVIFLFDWTNGEGENNIGSSSPFQTLVAFKVFPATPLHLQGSIPGKPIILDGADVFDSFLGGGGNEEEVPKKGEERDDGFGPRRERQKKLEEIGTERGGLDYGKLRKSLRDAKLSYYYYGYTRKY